MYSINIIFGKSSFNKCKINTVFVAYNVFYKGLSKLVEQKLCQQNYNFPKHWIYGIYGINTLYSI